MAAYLLAVTVPLAEPSVDVLVARRRHGQIAVAAVAFAERAVCSGALWCHERFARDATFWSVILDAPLEASAVALLSQALARLPRTAIARVAEAPERLSAFPSAVRDHAIAQWGIDWIEDGAAASEPAVWLRQKWVAARLEADPMLVGQYVVTRKKWSAESWLRAWKLAAALPLSERWVTTVPEIIDRLLEKRPQKWEPAASQDWAAVLEALSVRPWLHLEMCSRALQYCFEHPRTALSRVVAAAFFTVHAAALEQRPLSSWGMFAFLDWDRGLELRRQLVNAFCQGYWAPEDFVLAAREPWLLRKLCRRMLRQWRGHQLLENAYEALAKGADGKRELIQVLRMF